MRILINAIGSRGDVQPMLALAQGLRLRGHRIAIAADSSFEDWIEGFGLPFLGVTHDLEEGLRRRGSLKNGFLRGLVEQLRAQFEFIDRAPEVDLVVGGGGAFAARTHAEARRVPGVFVVYSSQVMPSGRQEPATPARMPRWTWPFFGWLWRFIFNLAFRRAFNDERKRRGLPPIRDAFAHILGDAPLFAADGAWARLPSDAPPGSFQCGQLLLADTEALDPALERFLEAGTAPVYVGFGSMPDRRSGETTRSILRALDACGARAVVASGWSDLGVGEALPATVHGVRSAPHVKLFPRCAVIVHHGGAGTTQAAARAGVPQVVVPHIGDQHAWGRTMEDLGAGVVVRRDRLGSERLACALAKCLSDTDVQERARALAARAAADGVEKAVAHLESLVAAWSR